MKLDIYAYALLLCLCYSCKTKEKTMQSEFTPSFVSGPPILIYKTKANYNNLVPVLLSANKTEIISYPDPKDIITESGFPLPVILNKKYLLDNRGIGENVAFLKLTYEEYSKLKSLPTLKELYELIIDKDPLKELCNCGVKSAFTDIQKQANDLIDSKKLRKVCKPIK